MVFVFLTMKATIFATQGMIYLLEDCVTKKTLNKCIQNILFSSNSLAFYKRAKPLKIMYTFTSKYLGEKKNNSLTF